VDTAGLTHAELVHYFWHFFRQQVGTLKDALTEVQQDVASLQASSSSSSNSYDGPIADIDRRIAKVDDDVSTCDKAWREEAARLAREIEAIRAKPAPSGAQVVQSSASNRTNWLEVDLKNLKAELASLDDKRVHHEQRLEAFQEGMAKFQEGLDVLRTDFNDSSREHRTNSVELRELISKSACDLRISLQTDIVQSVNKNYFHIENELAQIQATFEADHQSLRADMEQGIKDQYHTISDNHHAQAGSIRILDSTLRSAFAEECSNHRAEVSEFCSSWKASLDALNNSSDDSFAYVKTLITDVSSKHQRNYSALCDRFSDLEGVVSEGSRESAIVRQRVNELRSVPLIRGALNQDT